MKECRKCKQHKEVKDFYKRKDTKDGLQYKCKPCVQEENSFYYKKFKEKRNKSKKRYYYQNREKYLKNKRIYYKNNREEIREKQNNYKKQNRAKYNYYNSRERAYKLEATPTWSNQEKIQVLYEKAKWLESLTGLKYHVDHIIPLKGDNVCGLHIWNNLQILESTLNCKKSNKVNDSWSWEG